MVSIDSLIVYESKYCFQEYLDNCTYKIVDKQMTIFLILMKICLIKGILQQD